MSHCSCICEAARLLWICLEHAGLNHFNGVLDHCYMPNMRLPNSYRNVQLVEVAMHVQVEAATSPVLNLKFKLPCVRFPRK
jgi:hypothetical protein